jgi:hypothetical protein
MGNCEGKISGATSLWQIMWHILFKAALHLFGGSC